MWLSLSVGPIQHDLRKDVQGDWCATVSGGSELIRYIF